MKNTKQCESNYCYSQDSNRSSYRYFASKTVYPWRNVNDIISDYLNIPNCTPIKIWSIFRHGSRLPSKKEVTYGHELFMLRNTVLQDYEKRMENYSCRLCDSDLALLREWQVKNITEDTHYYLAKQGWDDLYHLGVQFRQMFPTLYKPTYSPNIYKFRVSSTQRMTSSFMAFCEGVFGQNARNMIPVPEEDITDQILLTPHLFCPISKANSERNDHEEVIKFHESPKFQQMISDVSFRLGFSELDEEYVTIMWIMCQFEQSWRLDETNKYAWCSVFTPEELKLYDYLEDLLYYYTKSSGFHTNEHSPCLTIVDMLDYLESNELTAPKVVTYFIHSTMMYLMVTALGISRDIEPIRADNYEQMSNRLFKSSEIVPFSSNLAAVKYNCLTDTNTRKNATKILFLLNQKPVQSLKWCENGFCDWMTVKEKLRRFTPSVCQRTFCKPNKSQKIGNLSKQLQIQAATTLSIILINILRNG